jgi:centromeric protein E
VRIRPLLEAELLAREATAWRPSSADGLQFTDPQRPAAAQQRQQAALTYSRVFSEVTTSEAVYGDAARGLLAAALRGFNATLLAYGPTGSGKTFTMQGVMACAAQDLFRLVAAEPGRECIVRLSALEVYNEVVRDLLQERCPSVKLVDDPLRGPTADGATEACVASQEQLQQLLADIAARRQVRGLIAAR